MISNNNVTPAAADMAAISAAAASSDLFVTQPGVEADGATQIHAFEEILKRFEQNTLTERDKGTAFELLVLEVLSKTQPWCEKFVKVQTYADWAKEHKNLSGNDARDTGIDLVATNRVIPEIDGQEYGLDNNPSRGGAENKLDASFTAIQCKFFGREQYIPKGQVDSFANASDRTYFTGRIFVYTGQLSEHAEHELTQDRKVPIKSICYSQLAEANLDWAGYLKTGKLVVTRRILKDYQLEALENVVEGFKHHPRGKLIMACGTGKTFTSLKIAERQTGNNGFVLFLVPSLALLSQTLLDWKLQASAPMSAFAVCSDSKVGKSGDENDFASYLRPSELNFPATTDAKSLAAEVLKDTLRKAQGLVPENGMTVVFSTYQSLDVIHQAQTDFKLPAFDLIICDEAHRTAGGYLVADRKDIKQTAAQTPMTQQLDAQIGGTEQASTSTAGDTESKTKARKPRQRRGAASDVDDESLFTRIHDDGYIKGLKRLYMTATPKIYGEAAKQQETQGDAILYSMDDEAVFGPVFHSFNFNLAVDKKCLVDYKVIILATDKSLLPQETDLINFSQFHAAKVVGTWKALNKFSFDLNKGDDTQPMRRAVGFAQVIDSKSKYDKVGSKQFTQYFQEVIEGYRDHLAEVRDTNGRATEELAYVNEHNLVCDCRHIDGSMNAVEKGERLDWLRADPEDNHCKILFNVRCLSEGVDVPSLDAVIFLSPRKSQVEVVQTVGRVMRTAPGKTRGYVIIPIVTDNLEHPETIFDQNKDFDVVWQVLKALKSINPDCVFVDGRTGKLDGRIEIICKYNDPLKSKSTTGTTDHHNRKHKDDKGQGGDDDRSGHQGGLGLDEHISTVEEAIKSVIVKKIGNRKEWQDWAEDVAGICTDQIKAIKSILDGNSDPELKAKFGQFCHDINVSMSQHFTDEQVIEMLAQHIVIKPVLDELFPQYDFTKLNPIARALTNMVEVLDAEGLSTTTEQLGAFYESVKTRMQNVTSVQDRQKVIVDLFDRFFKEAFPKQQDKLGIVYTPVEVVDFINHSVNDILQQEFGLHLGSPEVPILEPFTGTGTFLTRMMQCPELISLQELPHKYHSELHGFEILPLAYYVASINIESVYHELMNVEYEHYDPNQIMVLTDTFAERKVYELLTDERLNKNNELGEKVRSLPFVVMIGNPPYSVGQDSANDDNQNDSYPALEQRISDTYVARAGAITNKNSLYDSYIKAFRWASDHLGKSGIIAFVTNAGWVDAAAASGIRRSFQQEFSAVYVYHLKGNQRTSGEQSRKEGGKIFGSGSRAPIAITILVKNPQAQEQGKIYFATVDDYLSREEKLGQLKDLRSIINAPLIEIHPDAHGDWLNQRRDDFAHFITVDGKKTDGLALFDSFSCGISTGRDAWSFNSSRATIERNFSGCIEFYNAQVEAFKSQGERFERDNDSSKIKWNRSLDNQLRKGITLAPFSQGFVVKSVYRPFFKQFLYNDKSWIEMTYLMPKLFPAKEAENLVIGVTGLGAREFSCLMSGQIPCLDFLEKSQCFPRYLYRKLEPGASAQRAGGFMDALEDGIEPRVIINGYERVDAIRPEAVQHFKDAYLEEAAAIDADAVFYYIYGILHSQDYRTTYANNLQKELPRIPRVASYADFYAFSEAGRALAKLHVDYEKVKPYEGCTFNYAKGKSSANMDYYVKQLKYGKIKGKTGNAAKDKSVIIYNACLSLSDIPLEAQEYVVNKKSALDWVVERCGVSVDKSSRIVNDYNDYAAEVGNESYILDLILRVITVSLETVKIVKSLPALTIHKLDQ